jgi:hypothetical protein
MGGGADDRAACSGGVPDRRGSRPGAIRARRNGDRGQSAAPPPTRRPRLRVGPEIGFFLPTDDKTRARFGSTWVTFGIGFGSVLSRAQSQGQFLLDLDVYTRSRSGNRAVIVPIGVQYRRSLIGGGGGSGGDLADRSSFVPYVGASANLVVVSLRVPDEDIDSTRVTAGAGVALGAMVGEAGYAEARYLFTGRTLGYDTSGFTVSVGLRF